MVKATEREIIDMNRDQEETPMEANINSISISINSRTRTNSTPIKALDTRETETDATEECLSSLPKLRVVNCIYMYINESLYFNRFLKGKINKSSLLWRHYVVAIGCTDVLPFLSPFLFH